MSRQFVDLFTDTKVNQLDVSILRQHNVGRVDVTMDVTSIMESHQTRKDIDDNNFCKMHWVCLVILQHFLYKRNFLPMHIITLTFQQIRKTDSSKQLTYYMIMLLQCIPMIAFSLHKAYHFHKIIVSQLDGCLPTCSFYSVSRKVVI